MKVPPQVILGTSNLMGNRLLESRDSAADITSRFQSPMEIASVFNDAARRRRGRDYNAESNRRSNALKKIRQTFPELRVCPIIPNVIGYVREATDCGIVGAAQRRIQQMALLDLVKIGVRCALKAPGVLKRDFNTLLSILLEVELASFKRSVDSYALQSWRFSYEAITGTVRAIAAVGLVRSHCR